MTDFMHYILCICFAFMGSIEIYGQEVVMSQPVSVSLEVDYKLIGQYGDNTYLYRQTDHSVLIQCFNRKLESEWTREIDLRKQKLLPVKVIGGSYGFSVFYYQYKKGYTNVLIHKFNTLAELKETVVVAKFKGCHQISSDDIVSSSDRTKCLISKKGARRELAMAFVDLNKLDKSIQVIYTFSDLNLNKDYRQLLVNNEGVGFLVCAHHGRLKRIDGSYLKCIALKADHSVEPFKIRTAPGMRFQKMKFTFDEANQALTGAGVYSLKANTADGVFYCRVNFLDKPVFSQIPFEESFVRKVTGRLKKQSINAYGLEARDVILRKDGGILLVLEQNISYGSLVESSEYNSTHPNTKKEDFLSENVLLVSMHPTGLLHWNKVLHKKQSSFNDNGRFTSFFLLKGNRNLKFIYNDGAQPFSEILEYTVSAHGNVERNLLPAENRIIQPELKRGIQTSANELIAVSSRNQKLRLLKIRYD
jgi:hypothetical protein